MTKRKDKEHQSQEYMKSCIEPKRKVRYNKNKWCRCSNADRPPIKYVDELPDGYFMCKVCGGAVSKPRKRKVCCATNTGKHQWEKGVCRMCGDTKIRKGDRVVEGFKIIIKNKKEETVIHIFDYPMLIKKGSQVLLEEL